MNTNVFGAISVIEEIPPALSVVNPRYLGLESVGSSTSVAE
jgi:hypothetical protein